MEAQLDMKHRVYFNPHLVSAVVELDQGCHVYVAGDHSPFLVLPQYEQFMDVLDGERGIVQDTEPPAATLEAVAKVMAGFESPVEGNPRHRWDSPGQR